MAGKGDAPRPVNGPNFRKNFDMIFPSKKSCRFLPAAHSCPQTTTDDQPSTPAVTTDDGHAQR